MGRALVINHYAALLLEVDRLNRVVLVWETMLPLTVIYKVDHTKPPLQSSKGTKNQNPTEKSSNSQKSLLRRD